jgi:hypothetical protein
MMLGTEQNTVVVVIGVACSLAYMAGVNFYWPADQRRLHNELIGWQLSVLGTTYAVIIGFMLYTVWTDFGAAELNTDAEANSLTNLYRIADGLPPQQSGKIKNLTRTYVDAVINHEWAEMSAGGSPSDTSPIIRDMWQSLVNLEGASPTQVTAEDHALSELSALAGYRRIRLVENEIRLPGVLWFVLLIGAAVTIGSTCLFGASNGNLHAIQVGAFSLLLCLVLVAIADINRPFQGSVHVSDLAFRRAQADME